MLGDQVKSLIIISKAKGWDPNVIQGRGGEPDVPLENWNKAPQNWETSDASGQWAVRNRPQESYGAPSVGQLPESIPANQQNFPEATGPQYPVPGPVDWQAGLDGKLGPDRASKNSDPFAGMGGM